VDDLPNPIKQALDSYSKEQILAFQHRQGPRFPQWTNANHFDISFQIETPAVDVDHRFTLKPLRFGGIAMVRLPVLVSGGCWFWENSGDNPSNLGSWLDGRRILYSQALQMFQFEGFLCGELVSALNKYKDLLSLKNALQKAKHFILGIELDLRVAFFHDDLDHSEGSH
jgi:hypothetical protein